MRHVGDNPTSQVDRMIERGTRLIMDGENSALSSETDDTDDDDLSDDSDSDITDVSPLVSNAASPLGLSPVMSRRNLLASPVVRQPFLRHYSHKGHDGDVEDEGDEERQRRKSWNNEDLYLQHELPHAHAGFDANSPKMSFVVQELLKLTMESQNRKKKMTSDYTSATHAEQQQEQQQTDLTLSSSRGSSRRRRSSEKHKLQLSPSLGANPHHRHLRKSPSRRKNLTFTPEEARVINRDNHTLLEKLLAVDGRDGRPASPARPSRPANAAVNRRRQEDGIRRDNLALLRRLNEIRPSKSHHSSHHNSHHHHHHHNSHHSHHNSHNGHHNSSSHLNSHNAPPPPAPPPLVWGERPPPHGPHLLPVPPPQGDRPLGRH